MNIIKHFVWMYGLMDGWMDRSVKDTSQGFSFCGAARNIAPHRKIALSIFVYNSSHSPSFYCRWHNLSVLHHHHSSSLSQLRSGAQPDGLQAVMMRDVQLSGNSHLHIQQPSLIFVSYHPLCIFLLKPS